MCEGRGLDAFLRFQAVGAVLESEIFRRDYQVPCCARLFLARDFFSFFEAVARGKLENGGGRGVAQGVRGI